MIFVTALAALGGLLIFGWRSLLFTGPLVLLAIVLSWLSSSRRPAGSKNSRRPGSPLWPPFFY